MPVLDMELTILDSMLRRSAVIDSYVSLIWTDRMQDLGDFQLIVHSTRANRALYQADVMLGLSTSDRVMVIETIQDQTDDQGNQQLTITGHDLLKILKDRVAALALANLTLQPNWPLSDTPGNIARTIFNNICVLGTLASTDIIPLINYPGSLYPPDTVIEPSTVITLDLTPTDVFTAIQTNIIQKYTLGFRLYKGLDTSQLYFEIYAGVDRTSHQTLYPAVVFSPDLDNLADMTELTTDAGTKNVAYVFAVNDWTIVYAQGADATTTGFSKKVLYVDASDITTAAGPTLTAQLQQRGLEQLAINGSSQAFDGEIPTTSQYTPGIDYNLGDLVEVRNSDGVSNDMLVTENIFASDAQGQRSYPTLTTSVFIKPGSWLGYSAGIHWLDVNPSVTWLSLPGS